LENVRLVFVPNRSKEFATHCFERIAGGPRTLEPAKKNLVNVNKLVFDDRLHFDSRAIGPWHGKQDQWGPVAAMNLNCSALAAGQRLRHPATRHITDQIGPSKHRRGSQLRSNDRSDCTPETDDVGTSLSALDER
jgi:hypothetical protein